MMMLCCSTILGVVATVHEKMPVKDFVFGNIIIVIIIITITFIIITDVIIIHNSSP